MVMVVTPHDRHSARKLRGGCQVKVEAVDRSIEAMIPAVRSIEEMIPAVHSTDDKRRGTDMKTHSRVFLSPASSDKKGELVEGELVEVEYNDEAPQYLEPLVENDATAKLRHQLHEAQAKLRHAKSKGVGVAQAQKNLEAAKQAMDAAHREQQKGREQQRTGIDHGAPSPFSRDTRQFMEPVSYADNDYDDDDDEADDADDDALEAKISAAVSALEKAQSDGKPQSEVLRLAEVVRVLREQLQTPLRETDPPRKAHIDQNPGGEADTGAIEAPFPGAKKLPDSGTKVKWGKFFAGLDARLSAKRKALQATHSADVCCSGQYLCAKCQAKKAAAT
jgi:hypothetical protein